MLRIVEVQVENIKGVRSAKFKLDTVTILRGKNGSGKSSVLDAIRSIFAGGLDPDHLRIGADRGFGSMKLSDGTTITKVIRRKKNSVELTADLEIKDPKGVVVPSPKTFVETLADSTSVDPAAILQYDTSKADGMKKFIQFLLQVLPISFSQHEIKGICVCDDESVLTPLETPCKPINLVELRKIRGYVEEGRRRLGVEADNAKGALVSLQGSLPPDDGADWSAKARELSAEILAIVKDVSAAAVSIKTNATEERAHINVEYGARIAELRALLAKAEADQREALDGVNQRERDAIAKNDQVANPELARLNSEMVSARERGEAQQRAAGVRNSIGGFQEKEQAARRKYDLYTGILESLDRLRKSKLENIPVPGLEFDGERVTYQGVPWEQVNTAGRVKVAVALAAESSRGSLGFLIVDDLEHLDGDTMTELMQALKDAGFQVLAAMVDDVDTPEGQQFLIETHQ